MKRLRIISATSFLLIGVLLFGVVQAVLTPRWIWPHFKESSENMLGELYTLNDSDIQVFFLGASNSLFAVDPMRIYKNSGIVTYNLSTSAQPLEVSYYVLSEALNNAQPSMVILEPSNLFGDTFENKAYRYVIDGMSFGENKIAFAKAYAGHFSSEKQIGAFVGAFLPIYQYHDRWKELIANDFSFMDRPGNKFLKGWYLTPNIIAAPIDVDLMNKTAQINASSDGWKEEIENSVSQIVSDSTMLYAPTINQESLSILLRIKELCEDNGIELRLAKIPNCMFPQGNSSAWTEIKSEIVKAVAADYDIPFLDLMYDADIGLNWSTDSVEGGWHLNYGGAKKVSDYFADYLQNECGFDSHYDAAYEADIPIYDAVTGVAELQMTQDMHGYLEKLSDLRNVTVIFSATDDMTAKLSEESQLDLNELGLQTDFSNLSYSDSYLAILESGDAFYEASSNRRLSKSGTLKNGDTFTIVSSGWYVGAQSQIIINGIDYSMNKRGLNIVVYDNRSKCVLDSVAFDTHANSNPVAIRDVAYNLKKSPLGSFPEEGYIMDYEYFLMENGVQ